MYVCAYVSRAERKKKPTRIRDEGLGAGAELDGLDGLGVGDAVDAPVVPVVEDDVALGDVALLEADLGPRRLRDPQQLVERLRHRRRSVDPDHLALGRPQLLR